MAKIFGQLEKAQLENTTSDTASLPKGTATYRTDLNVAKVSNGTTMVEVVDVSTSQALTNKTLTSPTLTTPTISAGGLIEAQIATPATPAAGYNKFYPKADKKFYTLDSDGNEVAVGSGSGGSINLVPNGTADDTSATIFTAYADAAATRPVDGTGGAPTVTTSISSTGPIVGTKVFLLTKTAVNSQGQGWAVPFTVDLGYRAKVLKVSVDYIVNSGTFVAGSSSTESDVIWYIYDVTNSQLIEPSNIKMFSNSTTLVDTVEATFQTSSTGSSYRLIAHVQSTSALAYELKVDNVAVSPQALSKGAFIGDWTAYTPTFTGFGTVTVQSFYWSRVGSNILVHGRFTVGTPTATEARISLPSVTSSSAITTLEIAGSFARGTTTTAAGFYTLMEPSTTYMTFGVQSAGAAGLSKQNGDGLVVSGDVAITATIPIAGWGVSQVLSSEADGRVVSARYEVAASVASSTVAPINYATKIFDTHNAVTTGASWKFTAPISGIYRVSVSGASASSTTFVAVYKNGTLNTYLDDQDSTTFSSGSTVISLVAGDYLDVRYSTALSTGALTTANLICVEKLSGPAQISAAESINAIYELAAAQSTATSSEDTAVWDTKVKDTHGGMNVSTGVFTVPAAGVYEVSVINGWTANATGLRYIVVSQAGSATKDYRGVQATAPATGIANLNTTASFSCIAGDTLRTKVFQSSGGALTLTGASQNILSIKRVG